MRKIVLSTVGTTGDVIPYFALARGLQARGHQVRVCSHALHRERFERAGIEFVSVGEPFTVEQFNTLLDEIERIKEPLKQFEVLVRRIFLHQPELQFRQQLEASKDAHLAVVHRFDYLAQEAAIKNNIPWISVSLMPQVIRTAEAPVYPFPRLGKWFVNFTWNGLEILAKPMNIFIAGVLRQLGAPPRALGVAGALSPFLNLIAASPSLIEVRGDWPKNVRVTGPWFPEKSEERPPAELQTFLARHPRPAVITFGSMGGNKGRETNTILLEAIARAKVSAIVQSGYSGLKVDADHIFTAGFIPHDLLFEHAACVVHHAGAGTSNAVARAGVVSVTVPHLFDQYYWGGILHDRGVAPKPLFRPQLTAKKLAARIEEALQPKFQEKAKELGEKIRAEKGVNTAIAHIEALAQTPAPTLTTATTPAGRS